MKINDYIEQATAEFKERQSHWHQFEGHSLDELELVEKTVRLKVAEREALREYLLHAKRAEKARLERREKQADYLERAALTVAVTLFSAVSWLLIELQLGTPWREVVQVVAFTVCTLGWAHARRVAFRWAIEARKSLARLGKVD